MRGEHDVRLLRLLFLPLVAARLVELAHDRIGAAPTLAAGRLLHIGADRLSDCDGGEVQTKRFAGRNIVRLSRLQQRRADVCGELLARLIAKLMRWHVESDTMWNTPFLRLAD